MSRWSLEFEGAVAVHKQKLGPHYRYYYLPPYLETREIQRDRQQFMTHKVQYCISNNESMLENSFRSDGCQIPKTTKSPHAFSAPRRLFKRINHLPPNFELRRLNSQVLNSRRILYDVHEIVVNSKGELFLQVEKDE